MSPPIVPPFGAGLRTLLFVPAGDARKRERAWASEADAVILDLEDATAPAAKGAARAGLAAALAGRPARPLAVVRINPLGSEHGALDLAALEGLPLDAVLVPKADPRSIASAARLGFPVMALVETAAGILHAERIARAPGVALLMLGQVDLLADIGCDPTPAGHELLVARSLLVLASASAGLPAPIDGPCLEIGDDEAVRAEATRAVALGFGGKACIHPGQLEATRHAFTPSAERLAWAGRVVAAYEAADERGTGVIALDGRMIDAPVARRAYAMLERSGGPR